MQGVENPTDIKMPSKGGCTGRGCLSLDWAGEVRIWRCVRVAPSSLSFPLTRYAFRDHVLIRAKLVNLFVGLGAKEGKGGYQGSTVPCACKQTLSREKELWMHLSLLVTRLTVRQHHV